MAAIFESNDNNARHRFLFPATLVFTLKTKELLKKNLFHRTEERPAVHSATFLTVELQLLANPLASEF